MKRRTTLKATFATLAATLIAPIARSKSDPANMSEDSVFEVMKNRRSVRKYKPDPVPQEDVNKIIDAARMAATSGNQQPWKFLVIQDRDRIDALKEFCIKKSIESYTAARKPSKTDLEARIERITEYYYN